MMENELKKSLNEVIVSIAQDCLKGLRATVSKKAENTLKYILGQSIRQYIIPDDHWHLSKSAKSLWDEITLSTIEEYFYNENVECDNLKQDKIVNKYKGNSHTAEELILSPMCSFRFNDVFHCEHVIPVNRILDKLRELPEDKIIPSEIEKILDEIHICRMTKDEDRAIKDTQGREDTFDEIIKGTYNNAQIELDY